MTAALDLELKVQIDAYSGQEHVIHRIVTLSDAGPKLIHLNAKDVDHLVIYPIRGSEIHDPNLTGDGNVIAFDDMRISDVRHHAPALAEAHFLPPGADHPFVDQHLPLA